MGSAFGRPIETQSSPRSYPLRPSTQTISPKSTTSIPTCRTKSPLLKEIEKLKKNREERRARLNEQMQEKHELLSRGAANPNWGFSIMVDDYRHSLDIQPLQMGSDNFPVNRISVCVRKRPLNTKEMTNKEVDVVTAPNKNTIIVHEPKSKVDLTKYLENHRFRFDCVFNEIATNELVYSYTAKALIETIFNGGMATCFAYGQTGSGKTHTMSGDFIGQAQDYSKGIYALTAKDVFQLLNSNKYKDLSLEVSATFFEIYCGKVYDLLNDNAKLRIMENSSQQIQMLGLVEKKVETVDAILTIISQGSKARSCAQSPFNDHSSRSHAVFQIILRKTGSRKSHGKLSLIDLAGNERASDTTMNNRRTRMERSEINKSLLALKECIRALGRKESYLPFRASKLTQVLRDSFVGEKIATCMIAMISPGMSCCEQTLNTLRYANRVKELNVQDFGFKLNRSSNVLRDPLEAIDKGLASGNNIENFIDSFDNYQDLADEVVQNHKVLLEATEKWLEMDQLLLSMTIVSDYDVDVYAEQLQSLVEEKLETLQKFNDCIMKLRKHIAQNDIESGSI